MGIYLEVSSQDWSKNSNSWDCYKKDDDAFLFW